MDLSLLPPMPRQFNTGTFQSSMVPGVKGTIILVFFHDNTITAKFVYTGTYMNGITREVSLTKQGDLLQGISNGQTIILSNLATSNSLSGNYSTGSYITTNPGDLGTFSFQQ